MPDLICLIPNHGYEDEDPVYVSWLDGIYYIEDPTQNSFKLEETVDGAKVQFTTSITDGFVRFDDQTPTATITGLDHLEGETVTVTSGGSFVGTFTVVNGSITLNSELTTYQIGIPYSAKIRTTRLAIPQTGSALQGQIKRIDRNVVRYTRSQEGQAGQEYRVEQVSGETPFVEFLSDMNAVFDTDSRDSKIPVKGGFDSDSYTIIKSSGPYPMTTLSVVIDFTIDESR